MRSSTIVAIAVVAVVGCANSNGAPTSGRGSATTAVMPPPPVGADAGTKAPMTKPTFHVASDDDLNLPLMSAVADAEKSGSDELTVTIAPGTYKRGLRLEAPGGANKLSFVVESSAAGAVVLGGGIAITGKNVKVSGIVLDGAQTPATAVKLHAFVTLEVNGLSVIGAKIGSGRGEKDPLIDLVARAQKAKATLRNVWIVDSTAAAGALIRIPVNGPGRWASVELDNIALVGNHSAYGLDVLSTDALTIRNAFVAELALTEAWLLIRTHGKIAIDKCVLAAKSDLVEHAGDESYPNVTLTASEVLGVKPGKGFDAHDLKTGKLPAAVDTAAAMTAAREGKAPDLGALRALLK